MRIRKRSSQSAALTPPPQPPLLFKYQTSSAPDASELRLQRKVAAECSNMQENRSRFGDGGDHEAPASPQSSSDVYAEPTVRKETVFCEGVKYSMGRGQDDELGQRGCGFRSGGV